MTYSIKATSNDSQRTAHSKCVGKTIVAGSTDTAALTNPALTATKPSTQVIETSDFSTVRLLAGGTGSSNHTINYQAIGWRPVVIGDNEYWVPQLLAKGVITLGATAIPTAVVASGLMADSITNTVTGEDTDEDNPADDSVACLSIPVKGCFLVTFETDLATGATSAYLFAQLGE